MTRNILVSNRLPVTVAVEHGCVQVRSTAGGVATALSSIHRPSVDRWVGWTGYPLEQDASRTSIIGAKLDELGCVPVFLNEFEIAGYYDDLANATLWPLLHSQLNELPVKPGGWDTYRAVNEKFADVVAEQYQPGDVIWVHDYHLALLPAALRRRIPDATIGFFLHVPFPSPEIFRVFPWREELLNGLLGADLVGLHTERDADNLKSAIATLMAGCGGAEAADKRQIPLLEAFPLGIDPGQWDALGHDEEVREMTAAIKADAGGRKILVGVDRLDYTKGIIRRLAAVEELFERRLVRPDEIVFIQVSIPSRQNLSAYESIRTRVEEQVGRINSIYGELQVTPIRSSYGTLSPKQLAALYGAADVMVVTPLRDGMNLVCKEFIASRVDGEGVLVLSEFAGAADELPQALLVNPYDVRGMASSIYRALEMPAVERRWRMEQLRARVLSATAEEWGASFLSQLTAASRYHRARAERVVSK